MRVNHLSLALAGVLGLGVATPSHATVTTSAAITASTLNPLTLHCLDHCIIGVCIWLRPILVPPFYKVETTLRVRHKFPDVIGQSPLGFGVSIPGICPIKTRSFFPYYQSGFDALSWRNPEVELLYPGTYIPFYREVRNTTFTSIWGSVFPRNGILAAQSDPYKAAAVFAQRAADITTNSLQPHVYIRAPGSAANERTDSWQQIAPYPEFSCGPFGGSGPLISPATVALDDDKVWQLWRPYECCLPNAGAVQVSIVTTPAVCLL